MAVTQPNTTAFDGEHGLSPVQEAEENVPDIIAPFVGPIVLDDPNEWTRLAVALEQPEPEQIQIVVHGLLHEEVGVRRLFLPAFSISLLEEMTQGLWPELDYLNKVIYLVSPQPLQGHLDEITIILEFYDPETFRSSLSCSNVFSQVLMISTGLRSTAQNELQRKPFQSHPQGALLKAVPSVCRFGSRKSHYNSIKFVLYKQGAWLHFATSRRSTQSRIGSSTSFQELRITKKERAVQQPLSPSMQSRGLSLRRFSLVSQVGTTYDNHHGYGFMTRTSWSKLSRK